MIMCMEDAGIDSATFSICVSSQQLLKALLKLTGS